MFIRTARVSRAAAAGIAFALIGGASAADVLTSNVSYHIVEIGAEGEEQLVERDSVRPGEIIQYRIVHENLSEDGLQGIVVAAPVPAGVTLTPNGESTSVPALFEVQADLDPEQEGLEWATLPALRKVMGDDGQLREEPLPLDAVAAVRWTLSEPLAAGATALNTYRVRVN